MVQENGKPIVKELPADATQRRTETDAPLPEVLVLPGSAASDAEWTQEMERNVNDQ